MPSVTQFREIPNYPGYLVGDDGSVWYAWRTCRSGRILTNRWKAMKQSPSTRGYPRVNITPPEGGSYKTFSVHKLVLTAFVGPCPEGMECRHLNGIKTDCRLKNLEWGTQEENVQDNRDHRKYSTHRRTRQYTLDGKTLCLKEWATHLKVPYAALYQRIRTLGMTFEEAIAAPFLGLTGNKGGRKPRLKRSKQQKHQ